MVSDTGVAACSEATTKRSTPAAVVTSTGSRRAKGGSVFWLS